MTDNLTTPKARAQEAITGLDSALSAHVDEVDAAVCRWFNHHQPEIREALALSAALEGIKGAWELSFHKYRPDDEQYGALLHSDSMDCRSVSAYASTMLAAILAAVEKMEKKI